MQMGNFWRFFIKINMILDKNRMILDKKQVVL